MIDELRALPDNYIVRRSNDIDSAFRFQVFYCTHPDLARLDVPSDQKDTLLRLQFDAQQRAYQANFPDAIEGVIRFDDQSVGLVKLNESRRTLHLIELVLLEEHRNRGIGTALLTALQARAQTRGQSMRLSVSRENQSAERLYLRLGFRAVGRTTGDWLMEWHPRNSDSLSNCPESTVATGVSV